MQMCEQLRDATGLTGVKQLGSWMSGGRQPSPRHCLQCVHKGRRRSTAADTVLYSRLGSGPLCEKNSTRSQLLLLLLLLSLLFGWAGRGVQLRHGSAGVHFEVSESVTMRAVCLFFTSLLDLAPILSYQGALVGVVTIIPKPRAKRTKSHL